MELMSVPAFLLVNDVWSYWSDSKAVPTPFPFDKQQVGKMTNSTKPSNLFLFIVKNVKINYLLFHVLSSDLWGKMRFTCRKVLWKLGQTLIIFFTVVKTRLFCSRLLQNMSERCHIKKYNSYSRYCIPILISCLKTLAYLLHNKFITW